MTYDVLQLLRQFVCFLFILICFSFELGLFPFSSNLDNWSELYESDSLTHLSNCSNNLVNSSLEKTIQCSVEEKNFVLRGRTVIKAVVCSSLKNEHCRKVTTHFFFFLYGTQNITFTLIIFKQKHTTGCQFSSNKKYCKSSETRSYFCLFIFTSAAALQICFDG